MSKQILSIKALSELTSTHRSRLYVYIEQGWLKAEFTDDSGHFYWSTAEARRIAKRLATARANLKRGRGQKLTFSTRGRRKQAKG
jgi:hypothetical protein